MDYTLKELSPEEATAITTELKVILEKYDCEMQVVSNLQIMKRFHKKEGTDPIISPIQDVKPNDTGETEPTAV